MKKILALLFVLSLAGVFLLPKNVSAQQYNLEKIFYLAGYNAESGVASVNKNWDKIDILAPQYFVVNNDFSVSGSFGPKLKSAISAHNLKVMPLVANAGFSQKIIHNLLTSYGGQNIVIRQLVNLALAQNYIGWQIDFENINYQDKDLFTAFVQKAYPVFKKNNLKLKPNLCKNIFAQTFVHQILHLPNGH